MSQLIIENLTKTVGEKTLFKDIAFTVVSGEKVGLLGINGTGKSTLLSIIAGSKKPIRFQWIIRIDTGLFIYHKSLNLIRNLR